MAINQRYIDEIKHAFWTQEELDLFINNCKIPLKKSLKINLNKISVEKFKEITEKWGWHLTDPGFNDPKDSKTDCFYIDRDDTDTALGRTFLHLSWFFYIQEIAAWIPARFLDLKENDLVLDISAAPGWKSAQLADYLLCINKNKPWLVISNDVDKARLSALAHNINRMWTYNSAITNFNWFAFWKNLWEVFDHVLVDAPCSGEWTWFKSDAALRFWKKEEINKIAWTWFQLLVSALKSTKPWWTVVFSTCTLNPYENEENLKKIKEFFWNHVELETVEINNKSLWFEKFWELELLSSKDVQKVARFWPHIQKTWWFFISKIRKTDTFWEKINPKSNILLPKNPFKIDMSQWLQKKVQNYLKETYGIKITEDSHLFVATPSQIYITSPKLLEVKDIIQFEKMWIPILKIDERLWFLPLHGLWITLWDYATKNFVEITDKSAQEYAFGWNIPETELINMNFDKNNKQWFVILKWQNWWIWIGKYFDWFIKNKYIKI